VHGVTDPKLAAEDASRGCQGRGSEDFYGAVLCDRALEGRREVPLSNVQRRGTDRVRRCARRLGVLGQVAGVPDSAERAGVVTHEWQGCVALEHAPGRLDQILEYPRVGDRDDRTLGLG
jgi:hypothetical protein